MAALYLSSRLLRWLQSSCTALRSRVLRAGAASAATAVAVGWALRLRWAGIPADALVIVAALCAGAAAFLATHLLLRSLEMSVLNKLQRPSA